jgi:hypothetical protein
MDVHGSIELHDGIANPRKVFPRERFSCIYAATDKRYDAAMEWCGDI